MDSEHSSKTLEQQQLYANKAKTEVHQLCLKHLKNEIHACKMR